MSIMTPPLPSSPSLPCSSSASLSTSTSSSSSQLYGRCTTSLYETEQHYVKPTIKRVTFLPSKLNQDIKFLTCIREMSNLNISLVTHNFFSVLPLMFRYFTLNYYTTASYQFTYNLMNRWCGAQTALMTAPLNKL